LHQWVLVELTEHLLEDSDVKIATAVGFPLGAMESDVKRYETEAAIDAGAHEIDAVLNIGWLKDRRDSLLLRNCETLSKQQTSGREIIIGPRC